MKFLLLYDPMLGLYHHMSVKWQTNVHDFVYNYEINFIETFNNLVVFVISGPNPHNTLSGCCFVESCVSNKKFSAFYYTFFISYLFPFRKLPTLLPSYFLFSKWIAFKATFKIESKLQKWMKTLANFLGSK